MHPGRTFLARSVLITALLPTLGYPKNPTQMYCLSDRSLASYLSSEISAPLPNGLVMDAWNANVGYVLDKTCNHLRVTHAGTKSHLLRRSMSCLCLFLDCRNRSTWPQRVPSGSRASSTYVYNSILYIVRTNNS